MREVTIENTIYKMAPMDVDQAEEIFAEKVPIRSNKKLLTACLHNGDPGNNWNEAMVGKLPYHVFSELLPIALEVCHMEKDKEGEAQAAKKE